MQSKIQKLLIDNLDGNAEDIPMAVGTLLGFNAVSGQLKETIFNNMLILKNAGKANLSREGIYRNQELN